MVPRQGDVRDVMLEMRDVTKRFPGVLALDNVSLEVHQGEIHAICGENGAGKSTLMSVLSGIYPYGSYQGTIRLRGEEVRFRNNRDSESAEVVIIHQELALSPYLSIAENIFLGNERLNRLGLIDWDATEREAIDLLQRVGLNERPDTEVASLGVGKQQLVEIAKALSKNVDLLILDEPTAALNDSDSKQMLGLIRELRDRGVTCIIISHKLNEITEVADRVTILRDGQSIETIPRDEIEEERIIRGMVGRTLAHRYPPRDAKIGEEAFRIENWACFDPNDHERVVVDHVNLHVRSGEVVGLAGLVGAGRTELAMSVFGRNYGVNASGNVRLKGKEVSTKTVSEAIRNGLAYASEDRKTYGLNLIDSISRNISITAPQTLMRFGLLDEEKEAKAASRFIKLMGIRAEGPDVVVGNLSGGNQQKVVLSKWLFTEPEVLILDEPTRGVDVGAKSEIYGLVNEFATSGKAVLMISSEMPELIGLCDRIYVMARGRITGELSGEDISPENLIRLMTAE